MSIEEFPKLKSFALRVPSGACGGLTEQCTMIMTCLTALTKFARQIEELQLPMLYRFDKWSMLSTAPAHVKYVLIWRQPNMVCSVHVVF